MRAAILLAGLTLSQAAWADCVYSGAKRAYIQCIYDAVLTVASDVLGLGGEVDALSIPILILQDSVVELDEDFSLMTSRVTDLETEVGDISTAVTGNTFTINILQDSVVEFDESFSLMTSRVTDLEADVESADVTISIVSDSIIELDEDFSLMSTRVTALETTVGALVTDLSAAQSEISALQAELADAEGRLDAEETAGLRSAWISGNSGTISIAQQHGAPFLSGISKLGVGGYRGSFAAGTWSSTPHCFCAPFHFGGVSNMICNISQVSTTVVDLVVTDVAGTVRDRDAWLFCLQP